MRLETRKLLDHSFTGSGILAIVLMAAALIVLLAPMFTRGAGAIFFTATIAGDMGEADHVTGSARYHVLFAMALCLLVFSFVCNFVSEGFVRRARKKAGG